jgi:hypothetical protein
MFLRTAQDFLESFGLKNAWYVTRFKSDINFVK